MAAGIDCRENGRDEESEMLETIRPGDKQDHRDLHSWKVLLKGQVSIDGDEYVEGGSRKPQKSAVFDAVPPHRADRLHLMADEIAS